MAPVNVLPRPDQSTAQVYIHTTSPTSQMNHIAKLEAKEVDSDFEVISVEDIFDKNGRSNKGVIARKTQKSPSSSEEEPEKKLLGQRVELKWSSGRWYRGTICEYNPTEQKHKVLYDDGDQRWYHLPEMVFRFINVADEWEKL
eukprot:maker-scaffold_9-snap-gene-2.69-mRNA-1 protein AED:0.19 eAED:0.19 QI:121/1/1/1/0/0.5/2/619/142